MAHISIHNVERIRMNVKESEHDGRAYKVITLVSESSSGEREHVTFFTESLEVVLEGSIRSLE
tara:strand:+ start:1672 stop:1860 length:189 start_codon:yes stop_codon:yes gene_type:complete